MSTRSHLFFCMLLIGLLAAGCTPAETPTPTDDADTMDADTQEAPTAVAQLSPTEGNNVEGNVTFTQMDEGIVVAAEITGLTPGMHGFHIHENGDCSAPDASSAGGHYAPQGSPHGAPDDPAPERHMGDLGNLEADADGIAHYDRTDTVIQLDSIVGKAVIVHAGEDDLTSQPSGDAGSRLACGVIEM